MSEGSGAASASSAAAAAAAYKPGTILVTGGAGFIASHVAIRLVELYPETKVVVLDKLDYCASLRNLDAVSGRANFKFIKGDITSPDLVNYMLESEGVDTILHFAAQTHVDNSFGNSFAFTRNNIMGTHVLLEATKRLGDQVRRFVHVSTDEVYGESDEGQVFVEGSVLEPTNPYAATKAAAEFLAKAYFRSFRTPVIITRGNNVYGPHQFPEKLVPKFMHQLMNEQPLTIHGQGRTTRNYLHVSDVAEAFVALVQRGVVGKVYNIGNEHEISVLQVATDILKLFGKDGEEAQKMLKFVADRSFNDQRYHIDSTALLQLGWKPTVTWEDGLRRTYEWYTQNKDHWGNVEKALVAHPRMVGH